MWDSITVNSVLGPSLPCLGTAYVSEVALLVARLQPLSPDHLYKLSGDTEGDITTLHVTAQTENITQHGYTDLVSLTPLYTDWVGVCGLWRAGLRNLAINMLPAPSAATL